MPGQSRAAKTRSRGVSVPEARRLLLGLANIAEGRSYGLPSFLLNGRFFARFRDDDTVLVLQLGTMIERDVLMQLDDAFFFTEHYRKYPAVLIRLADIPRSLFADVVTESWRHLAARRPLGPRPTSRPRPRARRQTNSRTLRAPPRT